MIQVPKKILQYERNAARVVFDTALPGAPPQDYQALLPQLAAIGRLGINALRMQKHKDLLRASSVQDMQLPDRRKYLFRGVITAGLYERLRNDDPKAYPDPNPPDSLKLWVSRLQDAELGPLLAAVAHYLLGGATAADQNLIQLRIDEYLKEEAAMAAAIKAPTTAELFYFDTRGLPRVFSDPQQNQQGKTKGEEYQDAYLAKVKDELINTHRINKNDADLDMITAATVGILLLEGRFDYDAPGFAVSLSNVYQDKLLAKTADNMGVAKPNTNWYAEVLNALKTNPGRNKANSIDYREFGFVGQEVVRGSARAPLGDPRFGALVANTVNRYVSGESIFGPLELPPLSGDDGDDIEIEPDNVRAVALIYAAYQLEQMRLFDTVDRVTEIFMNGILPIGLDTGGEALDKYYWESEDRLNQAARYSHYSRVLGVRGGDVSREVQPNTEFNNLFIRFVSSVAEYDRQQRMADLFDQNRGLALTGEHVRKAGRDLAANASLYGWAYTHFAAQRLKQQIELSINILKQPSIQKAYSADNPWQVIERVAAAEFGVAPNIVRYKTMAEAGKIILDLLAKYANRIGTTTSPRPLFSEGNLRFQAIIPGDIDDADKNMLMRQTQYWLAVNGIKDDQIDQLSQPVETPLSPSIPTGRQQPGMNGNLDQIRQMVQQGQMPSMEQLQGLLNANGSGPAIQ